jgi:hypothetical protein
MGCMGSRTENVAYADKAQSSQGELMNPEARGRPQGLPVGHPSLSQSSCSIYRLKMALAQRRLGG